MRFLARRIAPAVVQDWKRYTIGSVDEIPLDVAGAFTDSHLSVFTAEDDSQLAELAAAMLLRDGSAPSSCALAYVERAKLEAAKVSISSDRKGDTGQPHIDARHCELLLRTQADVTTVCNLFRENTYYAEVDEMARRYAEIANANTLDYRAVAAAAEKATLRKVWAALSHAAGRGLAQFAAPPAK